MEAVRAPFLTRPTLRGNGVRDTSLTDFEGQYEDGSLRFCKIINDTFEFERQNKHLSLTSVNLKSLGNFLLAFFYPSDWEHQEELANILSKVYS